MLKLLRLQTGTKPREFSIKLTETEALMTSPKTFFVRWNEEANLCRQIVVAVKRRVNSAEPKPKRAKSA